MTSLSLLAGRTIASLQRDSLHQHLLYLILVWTTIKNNRAFNVKRDVGSYICRFKNKGTLVFHFLFYQMHIIGMRSKSISGVASSCHIPCTTPVGHTKDNMAYLYSRNLLPLLLKCNTKFREKYKRSLFWVLRIFMSIPLPQSTQCIFNYSLH